MQGPGQGGNLADDQHGRRTDIMRPRTFGQISQPTQQHALLGAGAVLDQRERGVRIPTMPDQAGTDRIEAADRHVDGQGLALLSERAPVQGIERIATMTGDQTQ